MAKLTAIVPWEAKNAVRLGHVALRRNNNATDIDIVDEKGSFVKFILGIGPNGLVRAEHLPSDLGFPLDKRGRIVFDET